VPTADSALGVRAPTPVAFGGQVRGRQATSGRTPRRGSGGATSAPARTPAVTAKQVTGMAGTFVVPTPGATAEPTVEGWTGYAPLPAATAGGSSGQGASARPRRREAEGPADEMVTAATQVIREVGDGEAIVERLTVPAVMRIRQAGGGLDIVVPIILVAGAGLSVVGGRRLLRY
jgi:hypothetical protein